MLTSWLILFAVVVVVLVIVVMAIISDSASNPIVPTAHASEISTAPHPPGSEDPRPLSPISSPMTVSREDSVDILLIGAGAMSTTLGLLLQQIAPHLRICLVEKLERVAQESTDTFQNAGTGHAGYCELNYTPVNAQGQIDASKALVINASFEESLELWSYLVEQGHLPEPHHFINQVPHLSFVQGADSVEFLQKRHAILKESVAFGDMEYTEDRELLREWIPLIMKNRPPQKRVAATRVRYGTDVDFGSLARNMVSYLTTQDNFDLRMHRTVVDLRQQENKQWRVDVCNLTTGASEVIKARFVFLGAGGGALPLLQKSGIAEGKGYGGFPVSGQWLICNKPSIIEQHEAKVYGKPPLGAPPMSVPHLDTRIMGGKRSLLFGPFAGFTTKYLNHGSLWDLLNSITSDNLKPMIHAGLDNIPLTLYLIREVLQSHNSRCDSLRQFVVDARNDDWKLAHAGKRVQIIKKTPQGGKLEFGTEVISSADGTLAALLGASPGASTTVRVMLHVLERCFPTLIQHSWKSRLQTMIPSYGENLLQNPELFRKIRQRNLSVLHLDKSD